MLVILRLALGWHFLYEGVWKLTHRDSFVAETEGFLSAARGPVAPYVYGLVPDIDGHRRLQGDLGLDEVKRAKSKKDEKSAEQPPLAKRWDDLKDKFVAFYKPKGKEGNDELFKSFEAEANKVRDRHVKGLQGFIDDNGDKIKAHFESLERYREQVKADPSVDFMRPRRWDQMQEYRKEAKGWCADLDAREKALKGDLMDLINKDRVGQVTSLAKADEEDKAKKAAAAKKLSESDNKPADRTPKAESTNKKPNTETKPSDEPRDLSDDSPIFQHKSGTRDGSTDTRTSDQLTPNSDSKGKGKQPKAKSESKSKPVADAAIVVIDFSPLAVDRDPAGPFRRSSNIFQWQRIEQMSFMMTYIFLAIGACLMLGLFTRLSALGGAAFMLFVVLCQPSYPGVYPTDPPQLGHALLVNKDFIEMIALLVIASTRLGCWTGMDFFLSKCCGCGKGDKS
jgi:uncharacterized membrane protein YphA (DoxX/SURF4 family)